MILDYLCTSFVDPHIGIRDTFLFHALNCVCCVMSCVGDFDTVTLKGKSFHVLLLSFGKEFTIKIDYRTLWTGEFYLMVGPFTSRHLNQINNYHWGSNSTAKCKCQYDFDDLDA